MLKPFLILIGTVSLLLGLIGIVVMGYILPIGSREEIENECVQEH